MVIGSFHRPNKPQSPLALGLQNVVIVELDWFINEFIPDNVEDILDQVPARTETSQAPGIASASPKST